MNTAQPGILSPIPAQARYLEYVLTGEGDLHDTLRRLASAVNGRDVVAGFGRPLADVLAQGVPGLVSFPDESAAGITVPSTQSALWLWLRGEDRGVLLHAARELEALLSPAFERVQVVEGFCHDGGRDLTGYEDSTENPQGDEAYEVAFLAGQGVGLDNGSFVVVQRWHHDLDAFGRMSADEQDNAIGRRKADNEELPDAPESAHVKRTAQESFDPPAFLLRRSMPWVDADGQGLVFVAFAASFDAFEVLLERMLGKEDGIVDELFRFTRPMSGGYFWCPPLHDGRLDLRALGFD